MCCDVQYMCGMLFAEAWSNLEIRVGDIEPGGQENSVLANTLCKAIPGQGVQGRNDITCDLMAGTTGLQGQYVTIQMTLETPAIYVLQVCGVVPVFKG